MSEVLRLRDAYRHPGFSVLSSLRSMPFDLDAFGLHLRRRRKKRSAVRADEASVGSTISGRTGSAISTARTNTSIWSSLFEGFSAEVAGL
jgi:hypothetical protein